jgi:hypothetical protein
VSPGLPAAVAGDTVKEYGACAETGMIQREITERNAIVTKRCAFLAIVHDFSLIKKEFPFTVHHVIFNTSKTDKFE